MEKDKIIATVDRLKQRVKKSCSTCPSDLKKRILVAAILIPIVIWIVLTSAFLFSAIILVSTVIISFEWNNMIRSANDKRKWEIIGIVYITLPALSLLYIYSFDHGKDVIIWLLFVIWATDIAAYFSGITFGGPKLAPEISPNKTWSGLFGGISAAAIIGFFSSFLFASGNTGFIIFLSAVLAAIEQCSDLLESKIKRIFGIKDTSNLLPGHGGLLDRIDGLILTAPFVALMVMMNGQVFLG